MTCFLLTFLYNLFFIVFIKCFTRLNNRNLESKISVYCVLRSFYLFLLYSLNERNNRMEEKPKFVFVGDSHMAFWALNIYFPLWECLDYGVPGGGLASMESFDTDISHCQVVLQFGTNDVHQLDDENVDEYVERYVKAVLALTSRKTYLFCIFPRNDYGDYNAAINRFIRMLNQKIRERLEGTDVIYLDVFDRLLLDGKLNSELTLDDLHLNGKGYSLLTETLKQVYNQ